MKKRQIQAKTQKFSRNARRNGRSHLKYNIFSEVFIDDQLNVFCKPMATIILRIMR